MYVLHGGPRSPFTRRVAIWLTLQGQPFERRDVKLFGPDFESFFRVSPVSRVPALALPDGEVLIETAAIIDYLEDVAPPARRLLPPTGGPRRAAMRIVACSNAVAEKGVALVYEIERRPEQYQWADWQRRLETQLSHGLTALDTLLPDKGWCGGNAPSGADVAAVAAIDFVQTIKAFEPPSLPRLAALSAHANADKRFSSSYPPGAK
jgi:glutathione S-transferase